MLGKFDNVNIKGIVSVVPKQVEDNKKYVELLGDKRVKKQERMTGIQQRHIDQPGQTTADLCICAGKRLLRDLQWSADDIRVVVLVTQYPSVLLPSTAFIIQKYLGISKECVVFDVNLGCSGYVTGVRIVASLLQSYGIGAKGLLLAGETQRSPEFDKEKSYDEVADEMLFGSGGTATAIEISRNANIILFDEKSEGDKYDAICRRFYENNYMDGERVFEYAINSVTEYVSSFVKDIDEKIDYYVFHQTQKFMLENIAMICDIEDEEMLYSLEKYGNTSSASIPITICLNREKLTKNNTFLLCGFGVGLACSIMCLTLQKEVVLELFDSDEVYPI